MKNKSIKRKLFIIILVVLIAFIIAFTSNEKGLEIKEVYKEINLHTKHEQHK